MSDENDKAAELGKRLGRAVRAAKPRVRRLNSEAAPIIKKAAEDAVQFAREHDDEVKQVAQKLVRARLRGPLGMAFDALATPAGSPKDANVCGACTTANAKSARFCSQCGAALAPASA